VHAMPILRVVVAAAVIAAIQVAPVLAAEGVTTLQVHVEVAGGGPAAGATVTAAYIGIDDDAYTDVTGTTNSEGDVGLTVMLAGPDGKPAQVALTGQLEMKADDDGCLRSAAWEGESDPITVAPDLEVDLVLEQVEQAWECPDPSGDEAVHVSGWARAEDGTPADSVSVSQEAPDGRAWHGQPETGDDGSFAFDAWNWPDAELTITASASTESAMDDNWCITYQSLSGELRVTGIPESPVTIVMQVEDTWQRCGDDGPPVTPPPTDAIASPAAPVGIALPAALAVVATLLLVVLAPRPRRR
jgi:hypothetical protein